MTARITAANKAKNRQAWGAKPTGSGAKARRMPMATGKIALQTALAVEIMHA
jgi:hypothetical protein